MSEPLSSWHKVVKTSDEKLLKSILDKDAVFYSPILFKPQKGRKMVMAYLLSAAKMFEGTGFHYVKELVSDSDAVLEFNALIDGIEVDGVDIISWNEDGKITEFKVMLRPFKSIEKVGEKMKAQLENMNLWDKLKLKL
ncbi:nuclear transport factor 2 family protein [Ekhidna sp. To15]|uniref:nuclear transport factor 2 family protein n=1 Tax=Ekhidna sp. To15 TaxID=3395267 RepID=UPI003F51D793